MKLQSKEQRIVGIVAIVSNATDAFDPADLGNAPMFDRHESQMPPDISTERRSEIIDRPKTTKLS